MATIDYEQALIKKDMIREQLEDLVVKSKIDGTVVSLDNQVALGMSQTQQSFVHIGSLEKLVVKGTISEYDTLKIEEGQSAIISSDVFLEKQWNGEISIVSYLPKDPDNAEIMSEDNLGAQYVIEVIFKEKNPDLKPGLQMLIEIKVSQQSAQTLPLSAVDQDGENNFVFVINNKGEAEKREVHVGIVSGENIEITGGVSKNENVIMDPPNNIVSGMEVELK